MWPPACHGLRVYDPREWRLFIDSSKASSKCLLLQNRNKYASVWIGQLSVYLKEMYENMKVLISKCRYSAHNWLICVAFRVVCMSLGQQSGSTKYHRLVCRKQNIGNKNDGLREMILFLEKNICNRALVLYQPQPNLLYHHFKLSWV